MQLPFFNKIQSPHIKKYAANTGWLFADNFLKQGINVLVGVFLARYLNPAGLGNISYASTYMQILNPLALFGINALAIKEFVNKEYTNSEVIGTAFWVKVCSSIAAFIMLLSFAGLAENNAQMQGYIVVVGLTYLLYPFQVIDFYFQANLQAKFTVISQQISTITCAALKIGGMAMGASLTFFVWLIVIEVLITTINQVIFYKRKGFNFNWKYNKALGTKMLKEATPIILTGFFIAIYMRLDQFMIQKMLDSSALGNFTAAVKLSEAFYVVPGLVAGSLFPAIINGLKISREEYLIRMQKLYSVFAIISITAIIGVLLFGNFAVSILYGDAYTQTADVLKLHFANSLFVFFGVAYSQAFIVEGMQKFTTINTAIGAVLNVLLNLWLIPKMGVLGAALATLIAQFYSGFFCLLFFEKTRVHFKLMLKAFNFIHTIKVYSGKFSALKNPD